MTDSAGSGSDLEKVVELVRTHAPPPRFCDLTANTDLRNDLRMLWEDAEELMASFFDTFGVSQGDFETARYFPTEGDLVTAFFGSLFGKKRPEPPRLTIGMLAGALRDGAWKSEALEREFGSGAKEDRGA